jgi:hypothetical protein
VKKGFCSFLLSILTYSVFCQQIPPGTNLISEVVRRSQLSRPDTASGVSLLFRPVIDYQDLSELGIEERVLSESNAWVVKMIPVYSVHEFTNNRPYGSSPSLMGANAGLQHYLSTGITVKNNFFHFQFQPEISFAQNRSYQGFSDQFDEKIISDRFHFWNYNDSPERFSDGWKGEFWWGQSSLSFQYGAFEIGAATRNSWWGPGQFNSLTFSNNARGFPHFTINTTKPAKTFLGNFEGQLLSGKLVSSMIPSSQNQQLMRNFPSDLHVPGWVLCFKQFDKPK